MYGTWGGSFVDSTLGPGSLRRWHAASMKGSDGCRMGPKSNLWGLKDDVGFDCMTTGHEVSGVFWGYGDDEPLRVLPFDGLPTEGESDDEWG